MDALVEMAGVGFEVAQARLEIAIFKAERRAYGEEEIPSKCVAWEGAHEACVGAQPAFVRARANGLASLLLCCGLNVPRRPPRCPRVRGYWERLGSPADGGVTLPPYRAPPELRVLLASGWNDLGYVYPVCARERGVPHLLGLRVQGRGDGVKRLPISFPGAPPLPPRNSHRRAAFPIPALQQHVVRKRRVAAVR